MLKTLSFFIFRKKQTLKLEKYLLNSYNVTLMSEKNHQLLVEFEYRPQFNQFLVDYKAEHNKRLIIKEVVREAIVSYIQNEYDVYLPDVELRDVF